MFLARAFYTINQERKYYMCWLIWRTFSLSKSICKQFGARAYMAVMAMTFSNKFVGKKMFLSLFNFAEAHLLSDDYMSAPINSA